MEDRESKCPMIVLSICLLALVVVTSEATSDTGSREDPQGQVISDIKSIQGYSAGASDYREAIKKSVFGDMGRIYKVDPLLLYSMALLASSKSVSGGVMPWPYTITVNGHRHYYDDIKSAESALDTFIASGEKNIAIGLMQVNIAYYPYGLPRMLLDPLFNVSEGARLLKASMATTKDYHDGIGRYFSWNAEESNQWGKRVLEQYKRLIY